MTKARLTYFRGRGRAESTRWMLAASGVDFENVPIDTPEDLADLRSSGKLPFDQMPLLEIDDLQLSQSSAMIRFLARRAGLYGRNDTDAMWADMVAGVSADFAEASIQAAFKPSAAIAISDLEARFAKFGPRFEARITHQGSGFIAAETMTFADVVLAEALSGYLEWLPNLLDATPGIEAMYRAVVESPGISAYLVSNQRYPMPDGEYVIAAARVLQRALPPHMSDPDRFNKSS